MNPKEREEEKEMYYIERVLWMVELTGPDDLLNEKRKKRGIWDDVRAMVGCLLESPAELLKLLTPSKLVLGCLNSIRKNTNS